MKREKKDEADTERKRGEKKREGRGNEESKYKVGGAFGGASRICLLRGTVSVVQAL